MSSECEKCAENTIDCTCWDKPSKPKDIHCSICKEKVPVYQLYFIGWMVPAANEDGFRPLVFSGHKKTFCEKCMRQCPGYILFGNRYLT
jgi:hypothetical protein